MKLLFLADGTRTYTQKIIEYFIDKGYEIELITVKPVKCKGIRITVIPGCLDSDGELKRFWYMRSAWRVRKMIRRIKPDILHALYVTNYGFLGAFSGVHPFILTAYGTDILQTPRKNKLYRLITRVALKRADLIHSVAPHVSEEIVKMKISIQKILTYRYFVDLQKFSCKNSTGAAFERYTVLSTRNWDHNANLAIIMQAIPQVLAKKTNVWFIFVCNEESRQRLQQQAAKLNISQHIAFPGLQPHHQMQRFYQQADIFISVPFTDGMPYSLLEALACGTFPIVSRIAANEFWIESGVNGFTVAPHDSQELAQAIMQALDDSEFRTRAREINLQKIQELPPMEKNLETLEYHYFKVLNHRDRMRQ